MLMMNNDYEDESDGDNDEWSVSQLVLCASGAVRLVCGSAIPGHAEGCVGVML